MATISEKRKLSLDECRMLVLGTQVLISLQFDLAFQTGFSAASPIAQHLVQFITFFEKSFQELPSYVKGVHLACASLIALAVVLLMTPAAFHRVAEGGEESERLVRVAARCVVGAMIPLAAGMAGDFFVILMKITQSLPLAIAAGAFTLTVFLGLWFGYTLLRRRYHPTKQHAPWIIQGA